MKLFANAVTVYTAHQLMQVIHYTKHEKQLCGPQTSDSKLTARFHVSNHSSMTIYFAPSCKNSNSILRCRCLLWVTFSSTSNSWALHTSVKIQKIIFMLIQWNQNITNWPKQNKCNVMWHGAQLYWFHGLSVTPGPSKTPLADYSSGAPFIMYCTSKETLACVSILLTLFRHVHVLCVNEYFTVIKCGICGHQYPSIS